MTQSLPRLALAALAMGALAAPAAFAGAHTWDVNEVFSNASGTIQFVELREAGGGAFEVGVGGHNVTSNTRSFTMTSNVASPTSFKMILLATPAFAALPGAPTPDYVFPTASVPFFSIGGDTLRYVPYDTWTIAAGLIPTDGVTSYKRTGGAQINSPTNYAGQTGSVNANPPAPPGVPDGAAGSTPMTVTALDVTGSSLQISWDTGACTGDAGFHIVYGQGSDLPNGPGGAYTIAAGVCGMGSASPFVWNAVPDATDGTGLIWWLILADDGSTTEGSWGHGSDLVERLGPAVGGSSGVCGMTAKSLTNTCGH